MLLYDVDRCRSPSPVVIAHRRPLQVEAEFDDVQPCDLEAELSNVMGSDATGHRLRGKQGAPRKLTVF